MFRSVVVKTRNVGAIRSGWLLRAIEEIEKRNNISEVRRPGTIRRQNNGGGAAGYHAYETNRGPRSFQNSVCRRNDYRSLTLGGGSVPFFQILTIVRAVNESIRNAVTTTVNLNRGPVFRADGDNITCSRSFRAGGLNGNRPFRFLSTIPVITNVVFSRVQSVSGPPTRATNH